MNNIFANCCGWYEAILPHLLRSACAAKEIGAIDFTAPHAHSGKVTKSKSREQKDAIAVLPPPMENSKDVVMIGF